MQICSKFRELWMIIGRAGYLQSCDYLRLYVRTYVRTYMQNVHMSSHPKYCTTYLSEPTTCKERAEQTYIYMGLHVEEIFVQTENHV